MYELFVPLYIFIFLYTLFPYFMFMILILLLTALQRFACKHGDRQHDHSEAVHRPMIFKCSRRLAILLFLCASCVLPQLVPLSTSLPALAACFPVNEASLRASLAAVARGLEGGDTASHSATSLLLAGSDDEITHLSSLLRVRLDAVGLELRLRVDVGDSAGGGLSKNAAERATAAAARAAAAHKVLLISVHDAGLLTPSDAPALDLLLRLLDGSRAPALPLSPAARAALGGDALELSLSEPPRVLVILDIDMASHAAIAGASGSALAADIASSGATLGMRPAGAAAAKASRAAAAALRAHLRAHWTALAAAYSARAPAGVRAVTAEAVVARVQHVIYLRPCSAGDCEDLNDWRVRAVRNERCAVPVAEMSGVDVTSLSFAVMAAASMAAAAESIAGFAAWWLRAAADSPAIASVSVAAGAATTLFTLAIASRCFKANRRTPELSAARPPDKKSVASSRRAPAAVTSAAAPPSPSSTPRTSRRRRRT